MLRKAKKCKKKKIAFKNHTHHTAFLILYFSPSATNLASLAPASRHLQGLRWGWKPCSWAAPPGRGCDGGSAAAWGGGCERAGRSGRADRRAPRPAGGTESWRTEAEGRTAETPTTRAATRPTRGLRPRAPRTTSCCSCGGKVSRAGSGRPARPPRRSGCFWPWSWRWGSCRSGGP